MKTVEGYKEACGICEQEKYRGIHLYNLFICCECEQKMIHTEPKEEQYQYYLHKLKRISKPTLYS
ncbi:sigma factor G inhibitor Gin [Aquibacillus saliphilus]|uniref:sigma factor G inhibitor Gin n=1 Tax=Aquibacillus saliphilus TaxID=1909422 RepID=UPI001CEFCC29|nr:sigma factor G inhibitor Gin [Aquibacillus saliphilus]